MNQLYISFPRKRRNRLFLLTFPNIYQPLLLLLLLPLPLLPPLPHLLQLPHQLLRLTLQLLLLSLHPIVHTLTHQNQTHPRNKQSVTHRSSCPGQSLDPRPV